MFGPDSTLKATVAPGSGVPQAERFAVTVALVLTGKVCADGERVSTAPLAHGAVPIGVHWVASLVPPGHVPRSKPPVFSTWPVSSNVVVVVPEESVTSTVTVGMTVSRVQDTGVGNSSRADVRGVHGAVGRAAVTRAVRGLGVDGARLEPEGQVGRPGHCGLRRCTRPR